MKGKCALFVAFLFVSLALTAMSCAPSGSTTPVSTTSSSTTTATVAPATTKLSSDTPKYGGVINIVQTGNILGFDEVYGWSAIVPTLHLTNEELLRGDWAKGPAGTGETQWAHDGINRLEQKRGYVAETWEIPEAGRAVFHIRQGMHYALSQNNAASRLVNGRELTADDVVFSLKQYTTTDRAWIRQNYSAMSKVVSITAPDNETVVIETPPELFFDAFSILTDFAHIVPPEVVTKYGDMRDWRVSVGTGAFILTDFVDNSSATLVRNPNYWDKDPIGPGKGNQLPYVDGVKFLIITDASTRMSALRTGKIDYSGGVLWDEIPDLKRNNPELKYLQFNKGAGSVTSIRTDRAPFSDIRVRRALFMAIDFQAIKNDLYEGQADILTWPISYFPEYKNAYLPLEEASPSVQELYSYNPEKAQTLLADAGLPNGLKLEVICNNLTEQVDYYSVVKQMWAKVGIDLTIVPKEGAVYMSIQRARAYDQLMNGTTGSIGAIYKCSPIRGDGNTNGSYISDPKVDAAAEKMNLISYTDPPGADKIYKELMGYVLDQAWAIPFPGAPQATFWWPWVMNYHGEASMGFWNSPNWANFAWIDQELKRSMGH